MVSVSPVAAEQHLLVRDQPAQAHRVDVDPVDVGAARARRPRRGGVGRASPPRRGPAATSCGRAGAVPDGASTLLGWCSSMISTDSKYGAACSAKLHHQHGADAEVRGDHHAGARGGRPASRAPVEPLGGRSRWCRRPGGPRGRCTHSRLAMTDVGVVKSTTTSAPAAATRGRRLSSVATSSRSGAASTARHTSTPIRAPRAQHTDPKRHRGIVPLRAPRRVLPAGRCGQGRCG